MLNSEKNSFDSKVKDLSLIQVKTKDFKELQSSWSNKDFVNTNLDQILKNRIFSNQKVLRVATGEVIKLKIESTNPKVLDSFLNKILNKQFLIKKLELEKTYINLEIGIK